MDKVMDIRNFVAAAEGDAEHVLGKFLYFSLANLLVDKEELAELCDSMCIPYTSGNRLSVSDAFRSATGDIRVRVPVTEGGEPVPRAGQGDHEPPDQPVRETGQYQLRQGGWCLPL